MTSRSLPNANVRIDAHKAADDREPSRAETTAANESLVSETFSREAPTSAEHADCPMLEQRDRSGRRLRNRIIVANAIAWIAIIVLIRLVFF
jgi:hypothetical protein